MVQLELGGLTCAQQGRAGLAHAVALKRDPGVNEPEKVLLVPVIPCAWVDGVDEVPLEFLVTKNA